MTTIYDNPSYRDAFETEKQLRAKAEELTFLEGEQRVALARWSPAPPNQKSAFEHAVSALNGELTPDSRNADLRTLQAAHLETKLAIDAIVRGIPEAQMRVARQRDELTRERLKAADTQEAIARSLDAARELLAANDAMIELCNALSRHGYATGQSERDTLVLAAPDLLSAWVNNLASMQNR